MIESYAGDDVFDLPKIISIPLHRKVLWNRESAGKVLVEES